MSQAVYLSRIWRAVFEEVEDAMVRSEVEERCGVRGTAER